jgi:hypothetical protein
MSKEDLLPDHEIYVNAFFVIITVCYAVQKEAFIVGDKRAVFCLSTLSM